MESNKSVKIAYFSGTGGSEIVAKTFEKALVDKGNNVTMQHLKKGTVNDSAKYDLLIVIFAVHACNAPEIVYRWIDNLEKVSGISAVVISVSGGGEVIPNTACRVSCIKKIEKKGYKVKYERMLVMPSNWIVSTKSPLDLMLLDILPERVQEIVEDFERNIVRRSKPYLIDRLFSCIGEFEKIGAKYFGRNIKVTEKCSGCGLCSENCPACNIKMKLNRPQFGRSCCLCLGCIYSCPNKALYAGLGKFVIIKEGYDLNKLMKQLPYKEIVDVEKLTRGYLWSGVRKYLLEFDSK